MLIWGVSQCGFLTDKGREMPDCFTMRPCVHERSLISNYMIMVVLYDLCITPVTSTAC